MAGNSPTVALDAGTMAYLLGRAEKCFLCWWIHEDFRMHGKLTGWPNDSMGAGTFPIQGKVRHLELEGILLTNMHHGVH